MINSAHAADCNTAGYGVGSLSRGNLAAWPAELGIDINTPQNYGLLQADAAGGKA